MLLDPATLAQLRGEARKIDDAPALPRNAGPVITNSILKNHRERQTGQQTLRNAMAIWGGWQEQIGGLDMRTAQRKFFHTFGMDVMSAQGLGTKDAWTLETKIRDQLQQHNIVST